MYTSEYVDAGNLIFPFFSNSGASVKLLSLKNLDYADRFWKLNPRLVFLGLDAAPLA
jgi:hypothetical protein